MTLFPRRAACAGAARTLIDPPEWQLVGSWDSLGGGGGGSAVERAVNLVEATQAVAHAGERTL